MALLDISYHHSNLGQVQLLSIMTYFCSWASTKFIFVLGQVQNITITVILQHPFEDIRPI